MHISKVRKLLYTLLVIALTGCNENEKTDNLVFITNTGSHYHVSECSYLGKSKIPVPLNEAWEKGYNPCVKCYAVTPREVISEPGGSDSSGHPHEKAEPAIRKAERRERVRSQRCNGITLAGRQCKRVTKNPGGRCYQHQR